MSTGLPCLYCHADPCRGAPNWCCQALKDVVEANEETNRLKNTGIPTILFCPECKYQHVDRGEWATKPHRTHLCEICGHLWRPFEVATYGTTTQDIFVPEVLASVKNTPPYKTLGKFMAEGYCPHKLFGEAWWKTRTAEYVNTHGCDICRVASRRERPF
jgi:uncharacterized protein YlaI